MSIYSRDYMREGPSQRPGSPATWNVVTWLLVINSIVLLVNLFSAGSVARFLVLQGPAPNLGWLWTPFTYQFTHYGIFHYLGNMLGIFFLGRFLLGEIGPGKLVRVYLGGGLFGGVFFLLYAALRGQLSTLEGASASVLAFLTVGAMLMPHVRFQLLFIPIQITLKTLLWFSIGLNSLFIILDLAGANIRASAPAHFGGIVFGWLYAKYFYNPYEEKGFSWFPIKILKDSDDATPSKRKPKKKKKKKAFVSTDVDAILDKINAEGFQSLTDEEKQLLEKSSERLSKRLGDTKK
ncbi:MAG: rhomboid family intramembrane serine protease, partial [Verrucomicrobiota bacterium]